MSHQPATGIPAGSASALTPYYVLLVIIIYIKIKYSGIIINTSTTQWQTRALGFPLAIHSGRVWEQKKMKMHCIESGPAITRLAGVAPTTLCMYCFLCLCHETTASAMTSTTGQTHWCQSCDSQWWVCDSNWWSCWWSCDSNWWSCDNHQWSCDRFARSISDLQHKLEDETTPRHHPLSTHLKHFHFIPGRAIEKLLFPPAYCWPQAHQASFHHSTCIQNDKGLWKESDSARYYPNRWFWWLFCQLAKRDGKGQRREWFSVTYTIHVAF